MGKQKGRSKDQILPTNGAFLSGGCRAAEVGAASEAWEGGARCQDRARRRGDCAARGEDPLRGEGGEGEGKEEEEEGTN